MGANAARECGVFFGAPGRVCSRLSRGCRKECARVEVGRLAGGGGQTCESMKAEDSRQVRSREAHAQRSGKVAARVTGVTCGRT
jgi:hypothetical protein